MPNTYAGDGEEALCQRVTRSWTGTSMSIGECAVYLSGRNHRQTTGQMNLALAVEFARDWYLDRVAEDRRRQDLPPDRECVPP